MTSILSYNYCYECRKRSYADRRTAKAASKRLHPGEHKAPYPCPVGNGWHIGRLDDRVIHGSMDRQARYAA